MIDAKTAFESSIHNLIMKNESTILRAIESGKTFTYIDINLPDSFYENLKNLGYKIVKEDHLDVFAISWDK